LTALFALSNQNALGALRAFSERKLKVPCDVSLVTFDDAPFAEYLASPLSVVRQDIEAIGHRAAELLVEQIRTGRKPQQLLHRVPVEFIQRESIGPPKTAC
jgi:LacI family transcriptional regulator